MRNLLPFALGVAVPGVLVVVLLVSEVSPVFLAVLAGLAAIEGVAIVTDDEFNEAWKERKAKKDAQR